MIWALLLYQRLGFESLGQSTKQADQSAAQGRSAVRTGYHFIARNGITGILVVVHGKHGNQNEKRLTRIVAVV
jgi:hypothetical protein